MYKCNDCGKTFEELESVSELVMADPYYPSVYYTENVCPLCGYSDYTEMSYCKNCENELTEETYCEPCVIATNYHLNRCITGIMADTLGTQEEVIEMLMEVLKERQ